jgi:hypothetical protein
MKMTMRWYSLILLAALASAATVELDRGFGPNQAFRLESSHDDFGERAHGVIETVSGGTHIYPLPQSTFDAYQRLHPDEFGIARLTGKNYQRQEVIGPHQIEGNKLWFGKNFYHGEGDRGVGAFGFFDTETRQYELFSPPEVAAWEISAILVEKDVVWLGLDHFGEDISTSPGGLVRWDRAAHQAHRYPLEFNVKSIEPRGKMLHLDAVRGYAEFSLETAAVRRFEVRKLKSGASAVVPVAKFPPPPSHY